jgi:hypothetical protein
MYKFWRLKHLQFQLYTHCLHLRLLLHLQFPFLDFWLSHPIHYKDNRASRSVKKPVALLGNNISY